MSSPKLFDVHAHVQFAAFADDADLVIRRALNAVVWMVNVGTQKDTSENAIKFAERYPEGVYATAGLHPIHTEKSYHDPQELGLFSSSQELENKNGGFTSRGEDFDYEFYKKLADHPKVVAIGECGLDYYRLTENTKNKQAEIFIKQIELAREVGKPLMIHCREAFHDLVQLLTSHSQLLTSDPGICHFFSGTTDAAARLMDLGFSFSFGGVITFAREYEKLIKFIPLDRILMETDAPYVAPHPYRGRRNEPAQVEEVAKKIARILNKDFEEIARITTENTIRIFGLNPDALLKI